MLQDVFAPPLGDLHQQFIPLLDHSPNLVEALQKVTTIAQMVLLLPVDSTSAAAAPAAAAADGAGGSRPLLVSNTHLFFHPYAPHIRTIHTAAILEEAQAALQEWQPSSSSGGMVMEATPTPPAAAGGVASPAAAAGGGASAAAVAAGRLRMATTAAGEGGGRLPATASNAVAAAGGSDGKKGVNQQQQEKQQQSGPVVFPPACEVPGLLSGCAAASVMFCGDLNSDLNDGVPGVVELLRSGRLPADHWDWKEGLQFR